MLIRKSFPVLIFCLMAFGQKLFSQIVLEGIVTDNGSEPVQNALVELTDMADTSRTFSDYTDDQGQYSIQITVSGIDDLYWFSLKWNFPIFLIDT